MDVPVADAALYEAALEIMAAASRLTLDYFNRPDLQVDFKGDGSPVTAADLATEALTGVLFLATAVLVVRIAGTMVDGGRAHPYTRTAIPVEATFVLALAAVRAFA